MAAEENRTPGKTVDNQSVEVRVRAIKAASVIGIVGNGLLAVIKVAVGLIANSFALVSDGIDSFTDVLTSSITLFTASISSRPPDMKHPYGHGRAETIATKMLAFIIFFAGGQLVLSAGGKLWNRDYLDVPGSVTLYIAALSIAGKVLLGYYKKIIGTRYKSSMLIADAKNMRNDVLISASVFAGIFVTRIFNFPVLDPILAVIIGIYIILSALGIFTETSLELMDGIADPRIYQMVFDAANAVTAVTNPHKTRIRKLNNLYIIDMDIEVDGNLTVKRGHAIAMAVEKNIYDSVPDVYDVHVHVEPCGNIEEEESFGISEDHLQ